VLGYVWVTNVDTEPLFSWIAPPKTIVPTYTGRTMISVTAMKMMRCSHQNLLQCLPTFCLFDRRTLSPFTNSVFPLSMADHVHRIDVEANLGVVRKGQRLPDHRRPCYIRGKTWRGLSGVWARGVLECGAASHDRQARTPSSALCSNWGGQGAGRTTAQMEQVPFVSDGLLLVDDHA